MRNTVSGLALEPMPLLLIEKVAFGRAPAIICCASADSTARRAARSSRLFRSSKDSASASDRSRADASIAASDRNEAINNASLDTFAPSSFRGAGHSKYINNERFETALGQRTVRIVSLAGLVLPPRFRARCTPLLQLSCP